MQRAVVYDTAPTTTSDLAFHGRLFAAGMCCTRVAATLRRP